MNDPHDPLDQEQSDKRKRNSPVKKQGKNRLDGGPPQGHSLKLSPNYSPFGTPEEVQASKIKPSEDDLSKIDITYKGFFGCPTVDLAVPKATSKNPKNHQDVNAPGFTYTPGVTNICDFNSTRKPEGFDNMDLPAKNKAFGGAVKRLATFGITVVDYSEWLKITASKKAFDTHMASLPHIANVQTIVIGNIKKSSDIYAALSEYGTGTDCNIEQHSLDIAHPTSIFFAPGLAFDNCKEVADTNAELKSDTPVDVCMLVSRSVPAPSRNISLETVSEPHEEKNGDYLQPYIAQSEALMMEHLYSHNSAIRNRVLSYYFVGINLRSENERKSIVEHLNIQNSLVSVIRVSGINSHAQIGEVSKELQNSYQLMILPFHDPDSPLGQAIGFTASSTDAVNMNMCGEQTKRAAGKHPRSTPYSNLMALHKNLTKVERGGFTVNFFVLVTADKKHLNLLFESGDPVFGNQIDFTPGGSNICINNDRGHRGESGPQALFLVAPNGLPKMSQAERAPHLRKIEQKVLEACVTESFTNDLINSIPHPCEAFVGRVTGESTHGGTRTTGVRIHSFDPRIAAQIQLQFAKKSVREHFEGQFQNLYKVFNDTEDIVAEAAKYANKDRNEKFRLVKLFPDLVHKLPDNTTPTAITIGGDKYGGIKHTAMIIRARGCNDLKPTDLLGAACEAARVNGITIVQPDDMRVLFSANTPPEINPPRDPMQYGAQITTSGPSKTTGTLVVCASKIDCSQLFEYFRCHPQIAAEPFIMTRSSIGKGMLPKAMQPQYDEYITKELIDEQDEILSRYVKPEVSSAKKNQGRQTILEHAARNQRQQKKTDKSKSSKTKKLSYLEVAMKRGFTMGRDAIQAQAREKIIEDLAEILDAKSQFAKTAQAEIDAEVARLASEIVRGGNEEEILQLNDNNNNTNDPNHPQGGGKGPGKGRGKGRGGKGKGKGKGGKGKGY